ncbi:MAG: SOS response-associated peptidase [bacterium]|nr:SOS response-associated peptidase [bacterium]
MCGRYTLTDPGDLVEELEVESPTQELAPRYNIAPTQDAPVVRIGGEGERELALLRWGLIPSWAKEAAIGNRMINARSETVAEKPSFRTALRRRRCGVLADGFYEWRKTGGAKQPYHIHLTDCRPFVMAGLWERWTRGPQPIETFTIITTRANDKVSEVHGRMPVILDPRHYPLWFDPQVEDSGRLAAVLGPYDDAEMELTPVSRLVNSPANDVPQCVAPIVI